MAEEGAEEDENKWEGDPGQVLQGKAGLHLGVRPLVGCRDTRLGSESGETVTVMVITATHVYSTACMADTLLVVLPGCGHLSASPQGHYSHFPRGKPELQEVTACLSSLCWWRQVFGL